MEDLNYIQSLIEALRVDGMKLKYVEGEARFNEDVLISALNGALSALQYVDKSFSRNEHFILRAINETPWALYIYKFASSEIKDKEYILEAALRRDGEVIAYANEGFRERIDLARLALCARKNAGLRHFGKSVRGNKQFMLEVLELHPKEFYNLVPELKCDVQFLAEAGKRNVNIFKFINPEFVDVVKDRISESYHNEQFDHGRENLG